MLHPLGPGVLGPQPHIGRHAPKHLLRREGLGEPPPPPQGPGAAGGGRGAGGAGARGCRRLAPVPCPAPRRPERPRVLPPAVAALRGARAAEPNPQARGAPGSAGAAAARRRVLRRAPALEGDAVSPVVARLPPPAEPEPPAPPAAPARGRAWDAVPAPAGCLGLARDADRASFGRARRAREGGGPGHYSRRAGSRVGAPRRGDPGAGRSRASDRRSDPFDSGRLLWPATGPWASVPPCPETWVLGQSLGGATRGVGAGGGFKRLPGSTSSNL